jgi:RNA polymerase sigma factor (sigma-70 family)
MSDENNLTTLLNGMPGDDDPSGRDAVIRTALGRLERLAQKMLRGFPVVRRYEDTLDVLQNALVRLDRALRDVPPKSTRDFYGLAAEMIRRELIDLARRYSGPHGLGRNQRSGLHVGDAERNGLQPETPNNDDELEKWAAFHEAVADLPPDEREVFMLRFYHNWKEEQIATLFGVDERTIRRRWRRAGRRLRDILGDDMPEG